MSERRVSTLVGIGVVLTGLILSGYCEEVLSMARTWRSSQTYVCGAFALPISLWLMWRNRLEMRHARVAPSFLGFVALLLSGLLWMAGQASNTQAVMQYAVVLMLIASFWAVFGTAQFKVSFFPLMFLLFAVPFGQSLTPWLMSMTAKAVVVGVRLSGVPVQQNGLDVILPTGAWSVVEACSGIRYLTCTLMAGLVFAYVNFRSNTRRVLFALACVAVPIIGNWLRAYAIVMIGHLSNKRWAVGIDHFIYGYLFFALLVGFLFWLGTRWRESAQLASSKHYSFFAKADRPRAVQWASLAALVLALIWAPLFEALFPLAKPHAVVLKTMAGQGGWTRLADQALPASGFRPNFQGYRAMSAQRYGKGSDQVTVWLFYYAAQGRDAQMVQWDNRLLNNTSRWREVIRRTETLSGVSSPAQVNFSKLQGAKPLYVWHWMWLGASRTSTSPALARLDLLKDRLLRQRDDSAIVLITVQEGVPETTARAVVSDFLTQHQHQLSAAMISAY